MALSAGGVCAVAVVTGVLASTSAGSPSPSSDVGASFETAGAALGLVAGVFVAGGSVAGAVLSPSGDSGEGGAVWALAPNANA